MKIECPEYDFECPYFDLMTGNCLMAEEGLDPMDECDAFYWLRDCIEDEDDMDVEMDGNIALLIISNKNP